MSASIVRHRRRTLTIAGLALGAILLSSCATPEQASQGPGADEVELDADLRATAVEAATAIADGQELSGSIEYIGPNGGREGAILQAVYAAFTEATGVTVNYTGSQDTNNIVQSRVQSGNAPDVADLSLGVAQSYAEQGETLDVGDMIGDAAGEYAQPLLDAASYDGTLFGVYQGFSNFMLWYNPTTYTGPENPDWQQVADYTDQLAADGQTAWCIAEEAGAGSGFPGAQMIEALFAKTYGPDALRAWGEGELAWTSAEVKAAWETFGAIATDDAKVNGGVTGSLAESIATGSNALVADPAGCQFDIWGSWVPGLIGADAKPGENIDFFPVPAANPEYASTEIYQTTVSTPFVDSPEVRAFMAYIASSEAQALLASADQWTVANQEVPTDTYDSVLLQKAAESYFGDDVVLSAGPNVLADAATGSAFWKGVVSYLQEPSSLDAVLQSIQDASGA